MDRSCGVTDDGRLWCWGTGPEGQLGYEEATEIGDDESPADMGAVPLPWRIRDVALSSAWTCALVEDGRVGCWGDTAGPAREAEAVDVGGVVVQLVASPSFGFCARLEGGGVRCWGSSALDHEDVRWPGCTGEGGCCVAGERGPTERGDLPLGGPAIDVSLGRRHACVVFEDGEARCAGANEQGQLGLGHTQSATTLTRVDVGGPVEAMLVGKNLGPSGRTCARLRDGTVRCWSAVVAWDGISHEDCQIEVLNPNEGLICEPATLWEFACAAGRSCCLGDDEPASAVRPVPL